MKKVVIFLIVFCLISSLVEAEECDLDVFLINQDPYPAIPGEYVKIVFQVTGIENPKCENLYFELLPDYPLKFDPDSQTKYEIKGGTYVNRFLSYAQFPFKVRVDEDALDGENPIRVKFSPKKKFYFIKEFNLTVEEVKADFEMFVKNYNKETKEMTIEVLNIGKNDVEAVALDIPSQENITIKGARRYIVGDLDSNEYSSAEFKAIPKDGTFQVKIFYTDSIGKRRILTKVLEFSSESFEEKEETKKIPWQVYFIVGIVIVGVYWIYRRKKRKKE